MPAKLSILGKTFGRLLVVEYYGVNDKSYSLWKCKCECGNVKLITGRQLTSGGTKSCGCIQKEKAAQFNFKHGCGGRRIKTGAYKSWRAMTQRCGNENTINYPNYGGDGVMVCERWLGENGFSNFLSDMGERPLGYTLDRYPNAYGNYEPTNCRWAARKDQDRNKTNNRWLEHNGERMIISDWAKRLKTQPSKISLLLKKITFDEIVHKYTEKNNNGKKSIVRTRI